MESPLIAESPFITEPLTEANFESKFLTTTAIYDEPVYIDAEVLDLLNASDEEWDTDLWRLLYMSSMYPKMSLGERTFLFDARIGGVEYGFIVDKIRGNIIITRA